MTDTTTQSKPQLGSVFDLPAKSWKFVKDNWIMFAFVNVFTLLGALSEISQNENTTVDTTTDLQNALMPGSAFINDNLGLTAGVALAVVLIVGVIMLFFAAMSTSLSLRSVDGEKPTAGELFETAKKYWLRQLGLIIVIAVIVIVGLILLIVPGIIAILRLSMAPYLMFDRDLSIMDSIKASNELTKKNMGAVAAAIGLYLLISIGLSILGEIPVVGPLALAIGSIIFSLIMVLRYRELTSGSKAASTTPASTATVSPINQ